MPGEKSYKLDSGEVVVCHDVVRSLPGKRLVFRGEYAGEKVFVKLYLDPKRRSVHWQRELDGLNAFDRCKIPTAKLLYSGKTTDKDIPIIILSELSGLISIKQAWDQADTAAKRELVKRMVVTLARHHQSGINQTDMHLGNFMVSDEEIYSLDGGGIKISEGGVSNDGRLENLALFIAQLSPEWESFIPEVLELYAVECGWNKAVSAGEFVGRVASAREMRWREYRKKLFRNCTAFTYTKHSDAIQVVANEYSSGDLLKLLQDPDISFPGREKAIKNGNTCTVWSAVVNGLALVIKRYNIKSFWHGVKLSLFTGRGVRSWVNGHRLLFYGMPTPRPVALVKSKAKIFPVTYLLTEKVQGVSVDEWMRDDALSAEAKNDMAGRITKILHGMYQQKVTHGDLKASNILVTDDGPMLIDLDSMRRHKGVGEFKKCWSNDIERFLKNWSNNKEMHDFFTKTLKSSEIYP